ncbi:MAG: rod-binding protein [Bacteriovoracaceae bacterium]|nr:rod-binding protein [Bacteriovoracaceae bacterium]
MDKVTNSPQIHFKQNIARDKYKNVPKPYLKVAEGLEAQFTNHLLNQMRKTVHPIEPESQAEKIYKSMLDSERSELMSKTDTGLGIKDLVLEQIYPNFKNRPVEHAHNTYKKVNLNSHKGENHE